MEKVKRTLDLEIYKLLYWIFIRKGRKRVIEILQYEQDKIKNNGISIEKIQKIVSELSKVPIYEINKKTRDRDIVELRQLTMYLSKLLTGKTFREIGEKVGNKDHATVMHACTTIPNLRRTNREFREKYQPLFDKFNI